MIFNTIFKFICVQSLINHSYKNITFKIPVAQPVDVPEFLGLVISVGLSILYENTVIPNETSTSKDQSSNSFGARRLTCSGQ
jgi:hypothetical protein